MPGFGGNTVRAYLSTGGGASWRDWANVQGYLGSWRQATDVYANDNGTWVKVWISLTAPTTVTATLNATGLDGTLTWSGAQGAAGYYIYRNGVLVTTINSGATTTSPISVPDYDNNYTFSVASFFSGLTSSATAAAAVRANLATPVLSATLERGYTYSTISNYTTYGHLTPGYQITQLPPQIRLTWAAIPGITNYQVFANGNFIATASSTTYIATSSTTLNYQVKAVSPGNTVSALSNTRTLNVGTPKARATASTIYDGNAQGSYLSTGNGKFTTAFVGTAFPSFEFWTYQVRWVLNITSFTTNEVTNWNGRRIRLIYPGGPFEVPDGSPLGYTKDISLVYQDITVETDPYHTGSTSSWTISSSGTIGTFHVDVRHRIYYTYRTQDEITPTVS